MTKKKFRDLVLDSAREITGINYFKKDGTMMIDAVVLALEKALVSGEDVELFGFGKFKVSASKPRKVTGIDGKTYDIQSHNVVTFKPSSRLKRDVAQGILRPAE